MIRNIRTASDVGMQPYIPTNPTHRTETHTIIFIIFNTGRGCQDKYHMRLSHSLSCLGLRMSLTKQIQQIPDGPPHTLCHAPSGRLSNPRLSLMCSETFGSSGRLCLQQTTFCCCRSPLTYLSSADSYPGQSILPSRIKTAQKPN